MGLFDRFRRRDDPGERVDPAEAAAQRDRIEPMIRGALDHAEDTAPASPSPDPAVQELRERATDLQSQITEAMRRENTPANLAGWEDTADDVMLCDVTPGRSSTELQDDLGLLILSRPEAFHGTPFEMSEQHLAEMREELLEPDQPHPEHGGDELGDELGDD